MKDSRDGKIYRTVRIGSQTWMAENLNYDYNVGTARSYCYDNDPRNCVKYGRLYTWSAAMDSAALFSNDGKGCGYGKGKCLGRGRQVRGICPMGWHMPNDSEWKTLKRFVAKSRFGGNMDSVGYALKSTSDWIRFNGESDNGSDAFGFGALPSRRAVFYTNVKEAFFWNSTDATADRAYCRTLHNTDLIASGSFKSSANSVRCIRD